MRFNYLLSIFLCTCVSISACSTKTRLASSMEVKAKQGDASEWIKKGDKLWTERDKKSKAKKAIQQWKKAAQVDPTRADVMIKLAYAYYFMANVHIRWEDDADEKSMTLYQKGKEAAEVAIFLQSPKFQQALQSGKKWTKFVNLVDKKGMEALYWYCSNLGKYSVLKGIATAIGNLEIIKASMNHIMALDDTFFHGGPYRYFGAYESKVMGGDLEMSKKHFNQSIKLAPHYLDTYILKASSYATKTQNEDLFVSILEKVIAADPKAIPELEIENRNAQRVAQDLLENIEDYF